MLLCPIRQSGAGTMSLRQTFEETEHEIEFREFSEREMKRYLFWRKLRADKEKRGRKRLQSLRRWYRKQYKGN